MLELLGANFGSVRLFGLDKALAPSGHCPREQEAWICSLRHSPVQALWLWEKFRLQRLRTEIAL